MVRVYPRTTRMNRTRMNLKLRTRMNPKMNLKLRTRMNQTTMTNRKLRTKVGVRSAPTATLTKNAPLPMLEEFQHKNASSCKCADVRSGQTATLTNNAIFPLLEEVPTQECKLVQVCGRKKRSNCYTD